MTSQASLDLLIQFPKEAYHYGQRSDGGTHGVVLTKPHVVELILDLAGYTSERDLGALALLEPSCGNGAFLVAAVTRLLESAPKHGRDIAGLTEAITAFDIDADHVQATRDAVIQVLQGHSVDGQVAERLASLWVQSGDFLLARIPKHFDFVVGNPPYIRVEQLSPELQAEYRVRYTTLFDRADLYVAFIERSLSLLSPKGVLSFVCADRWTLNRYGAPLRKLITSSYDVVVYVDLHKTSPFEADVIAYPSIFVIARESLGRPVLMAVLESATPVECAALSQRVLSQTELPQHGVNVTTYPVWFTGDDPWVLSSPAQLAALRDLETRFPLLEEECRALVRIGVASGNDSVYIVPADADIESDRLLPLVMREDLVDGTVVDAGRCIINTFDDNGTVELQRFPRLQRYFEKHEAAIKQRHVAQKNSGGWFRTIDRVYPELVPKPKLLIPDIAGSNEVVLEKGRFFPHHNLYFVVSDVWDMEVLGGLLSSRVALFFVWSYAVKMRGGYLRFQAQYLRRIRVPRPESLSDELSDQIRVAFRERNFAELDELARLAYELPAIPEFDFVDTRK